MIHTNYCTFCGTSFLTNAIATQHCPRCRRLLRSLRALDALRARLAHALSVILSGARRGEYQSKRNGK